MLSFPPSELFVSDQRCAVLHDEHIQWLQVLDKNPQPLIDYLARRKSSRLGYYFEDLVAYWIEQKISEGFFESHVKVTDGNRDIGEFDFLFKSNQQFEHWETAVKFYLYTRDQTGKVNWCGPNAKDTLEKKVERMTTHQVRLSKLPEGKTVLAGKRIEQIHPSIFLKGYLFYPLGMDIGEIDRGVLGYQISPACLKGWWLRVTELARLEDKAIFNNELRWRMVPRLEWLAPRIYSSALGIDELLKIGDLISLLQGHFTGAGDSLLIAGFSVNDTGQWKEKTRGFIVAQSWPD